MAKSPIKKNWDISETIELITTIFEKRESIFDERGRVNAWTDIVTQLNDKNIDRDENQVKGKWKRIRRNYYSGHLRKLSERARLFTELVAKVGVILSPWGQQTNHDDDEDDDDDDDNDDDDDFPGHRSTSENNLRRPGDDRSSTMQGTSTAGVNRSPAQNVQDQEESHDSSAQGSQNQMERLICELTRFCQQMKIGFTNFEEELEKMKEKK